MERINTKYVFLDVVGYTEYTVEDQYTIVESLTALVKDVMHKHYFWGSSSSKVIFLPTGDGMCIVLRYDDEDDLHLRVALDILEALHNENQNNPVKYKIRIGLNENKDIQYRDINDNVNFAGRGINYAHRIMDVAEQSQIFVGPTVYEKLADTAAYKKKFIEHKVSIKHNKQISVYQYIDSGKKYLNSSSLQQSRRYV